MNLLKISIIALLLCSCDTEQSQQKHKIEVIHSGLPTMSNQEKFELIEKAIQNGDAKAYNKVASHYMLMGMGKDFYFYAFMMANKNNNKEAAYHVFDIIAYSTPKEPKEALENMDDKTRNLALFYLLKSYEMGYESSVNQVKNIFGEGVDVPNSSYFLQEFAKSSDDTPAN